MEKLEDLLREANAISAEYQINVDISFSIRDGKHCTIPVGYGEGLFII
jgi:hypothetical protein